MKWHSGLRRFAFYRHSIDLPGVLIVFAWLGIWLVWPLNGVRPKQVRMQGSMLVRCADLGLGQSYRRPVVFLNSGLTAFKPSDDTFGALLGSSRQPRARPLQDRSDPRPGAANTTAGLAAESVGSLGGYEPLWVESPVFRRSGTQDAVLVVRPSAALEKAGFRIDLDADRELAGGKSWQVVLSVEADASGRVTHVFIVQGSGDPRIDSRLLQALYRVEMKGSPGHSVSGRVTVSYDRQ